MRTHFEPDEDEDYQAAKALLVRRCADWAAGQGLSVDPFLIEVALDSRHLSSDGRLVHWTGAAVRRLLLEWIPGRVGADVRRLRAAPATLRALLEYLSATGLLDPRGDAIDQLFAAVSGAEPEYIAVLEDPNRAGLGARLARVSASDDLDLASVPDLAAVLQGTLAGAVLGSEVFGGRQRLFSQPPVVLPTPAQQTEQAEASAVVGQLRTLVDWVGPKGRVLTARGMLRIADARELVPLLGAGDEVDGVRSSAELAELTLLVAWAKKARLVRVVKGRLVQVAKAGPVLADPVMLWRRAFDAIFDLADAVCRPLWADQPPSMLHDLYDIVVPDVLNSVYGMEHPMPLRRLEEPIWAQCQQEFGDYAISPLAWPGERARMVEDLSALFDALARLGAVEITHGVPDELYVLDLEEDSPWPDAVSYLTEPARRELRDDLRKPGRLVALTGLGLAAMRDRLLAEGREAGVVGELAHADAAGLLGVVAEHYTEDTARLEISDWLDTHGDNIELLLQAIRDCPFRGRAAAMLHVLTMSLPDGAALLRRLRNDPVLAPLVLSKLVHDGVLDMRDLTERDSLLCMTESFLQLFELGGPDAIAGQLTALPVAERRQLAGALRGSGHPARDAVGELCAMIGRRSR
ncbi:hypothetical protein [Nocardia amamiensis]|uniref:hypothetical protein n=1 Tax=Nocardia amamiensis TaxID=404578 RepID=UPI0008358609|nr:hypothetical protein [Nocardia amamiensis]